MNNKLIIYDFDGVLVNSRKAVYLYYEAIFKHFNLPDIDWENSELGRKAFGMTHVQLLSIYAKDDEDLKRMAEYVPHFTREQMLAATPLESGVLEAVPILYNEYDLAICTNRSYPVNDYLSHHKLDVFFPYIITATDVESPKPAPDGAIKILEHYNTAPQDAVFIGDSEVDYLAAKEAGVRFIAYGNELYDSPVIYDHRELIKFL